MILMCISREKQTKDLLRVSSHQVRWRLFEKNNSLLFHGEGHAQKIVRKMGQSRFNVASYEISSSPICEWEHVQKKESSS
jgi:calcineurin-like phosphoesterase family protein